MKTVSMFLRAAKDDAEAAGESTEGMASSVSKLRDDLLTLTKNKVDIMADDQTFKSTYQIMKDLSQVWNEISDVDQANILMKIGGKRQANIVSGLLTNFDMAEEVLVKTANASGSALQENEKYLDSINGRLTRLGASYETLSNKIVDSELIKFAVNSLTVIIDKLAALDDVLGGTMSELITLGGILGSVSIGWAMFSKHFLTATWAEGLSLPATISKGWSKLIEHFGELSEKARKSIGTVVTSFNAADKSVISFGKSLWSHLGTAGKVGVVIAGIGALIAIIVKLQKVLHPSFTDLKKKLQETESELDTLNAKFEENAARIKEIFDLKNRGSASLVDEQELRYLQTENNLLASQIKYKKELETLQKKNLGRVAKNELTDFANNQGIEGLMYGGTMDSIEYWKNRREEASKILGSNNASSRDKAHAQEDLERAELQIAELSADLTNYTEKLLEWRAVLSPDDTKGLETVGIELDKIRIAIGGVSAYKDIWQDLWGESSPIEGANRLSKDFEAAAKSWKNGNKFPLQDLIGNNSEILNSMISYLQKIGMITEETFKEDFGATFGDSEEEINALVNAFDAFGISVSDVSNEMAGLADAYALISSKLEVFKEVQKQIQEGENLSVSTLKAITDKFPALEDSVNSYFLGFKTGKELLADLQDAYEKDEAAYKEAVVRKMSASEDFYNSLSSNSKAKISALAEYYKVDQLNFTSVEQAKLKIQASIVRQMLSNYKKYNSMSLAQLKAELVRFYNNSSNPSAVAQMDEVKALTHTITTIEKINKQIDEIASSGIQGPKYTPSGSSSSKSKDKEKDLHKEAAEKEIARLKHRLEMDEITHEEYYAALKSIRDRYYTDSAAHAEKYAKEILEINEELFRGERELLRDFVHDKELKAEALVAAGDYERAKAVNEEILARLRVAIHDAYEYGLDENSEYVQELRQQSKKVANDIVNLVKGAYDDFKKYADDFDLWDKLDFTQLEFLEKKLKDIDALYKQGILSWKEYADLHNSVAKEIYDTQKDSIETIIDMTMEMIEQEAKDKQEALDKQIEKYQKIVELKKEMLQDTDKEKDHEEQVAEVVDEIAKLQSKISQLSLDDSREAAAQRAGLEEELAEKQKELHELQQDHALDTTIDTLDQSLEAFEDEKEEESKVIEESVDSWQERYEQAIDRIDNDWDQLYIDLNNWMSEHRNSIDGPDSLKTSWENVIALKEKYKNLGSIEDIYDEMGGGMGVNPNPNQDPEAQAILDQMKSNSLHALTHPGSASAGLNQENKQLAEEYYQKTGRRIVQGKDMVWRYDNENGSPVYDLNGPVASGNPYREGSSNFGDMDSDSVRWAQYQLANGAGYNQPVDGNFYTITQENVRRFQKAMKISVTGNVDAETRKRLRAYHTGGIVDDTGSINDKEVVALLEKGEWVLDKTRQNAVKALLKAASAAFDGSAWADLFKKIPAWHNRMEKTGDFVANIEVNINHNGELSDTDAKRYGDVIGDIALEKLRVAFKKRGI